MLLSRARPSLFASLLLVTASLTTACGKPSPSGVSLDRAVREPSGITASPNYSDVFWVHGDSGTGNWLFAVDGKGRTLARLRVEGALNVDWEDITHDGHGNLWLGDIGNNDSARRDLTVYRIPEPDPHDDIDRVRVDRRVRFSFPEQTKFGNKKYDFDTESLLWWQGDLWLLTKHRSDDRTRLYRFPSLNGEAVELEQVASFDLGPSLKASELQSWSGQVTAAEAAPDGKHWALLSYDAIFVFELPADQGAKLFAKPVTRIGLENTGQVEGLTWDGGALLVVNEDRHLLRIANPLTAVHYP